MTQDATYIDGTYTYTYDSVNELTNVGDHITLTYSYDKNGNRTMSGYTTGSDNELTAANGNTYSYDAEGNMTGETDSGGNVWTFAYDYRDRMTGFTEKNSGGTIIAQGTYAYDALDRRIETIESVSGGAATVNWMVLQRLLGHRLRRVLQRRHARVSVSFRPVVHRGRRCALGSHFERRHDGVVFDRSARLGDRSRELRRDRARSHRLRPLREHPQRDAARAMGISLSLRGWCGAPAFQCIRITLGTSHLRPVDFPLRIRFPSREGRVISTKRATTPHSISLIIPGLNCSHPGGDEDP